jgi:hypothetical protein
MGTVGILIVSSLHYNTQPYCSRGREAHFHSKKGVVRAAPFCYHHFSQLLWLIDRLCRQPVTNSNPLFIGAMILSAGKTWLAPGTRASNNPLFIGAMILRHRLKLRYPPLAT